MSPAEGWQRLHPRMLLVHPVQETIRFLPVLLGVFIAGSASGGRGWQALGIVLPVAIGLLRYVTTSYRITSGRIELRRGLLERHVLSVPLDRVRTVDLTASPVHRLLGVVTVRIGTGTGSTDEDEQLDLDGLAVERARALRDDLRDDLRARSVDDADGAGTGTGAAVAGEGPRQPRGPVTPVLVLDPTWARFAPLTSTGVAILAGLVGVLVQLLDGLGGFRRVDPSSWADRVAGLPWVLAALGAGVGLLVATSALAVAGYLATYWGFTLTHADRAWHVRRGLLTTRETSLDDERVAGVTLAEPLGLRLAGGARAAAIATGLGDQAASASITPPAPRRVVEATARAVVGAAGPVEGSLEHHGPAATRRRVVRAVGPALLLAAGCLALTPRSAWWAAVGVLAVVAAGLLARDRARSLGHAVRDGYLVSRSGSLVRRREVLATDAVIGWNLRSTWFQRRAGLVTLVATTAGGRQAVRVLDVPEDRAVEVAARAVPGLVDQFRAPGVSP